MVPTVSTPSERQGEAAPDEPEPAFEEPHPVMEAVTRTPVSNKLMIFFINLTSFIH